jgi:hypothetical protein
MLAPYRKSKARAAKTVRCAEEDKLGKGLLLWLLGIPIPIIILILIFWH